MTEKIKEILDRLDFNEWEVDLYKVPITWSELYDIRDYITNLQKENERLKKKITFNEKSRRKMQQSLMEQIETYKMKELEEGK